MRNSIITGTLSASLLLTLTPATYAEDYYSTQQNDGGYVQVDSNNQRREPERAHHDHHRQKEESFHVTVSLPGPSNDPIIFYDSYDGWHRSHHSVAWINKSSGEIPPANMVKSGYQVGPRADFYVCRANYEGGIHPGKLYTDTDNCNISWGGQEIAMNDYQVLVSRKPLRWVATSNGFIPPRAIEGGYEDGHPLYICQARYRNGVHSGKVVGSGCNFGWGGREIVMQNYSILTK